MPYDYDDPRTAASPNRSGEPRFPQPGETAVTREQLMRDRGYPEHVINPPPKQARLAENPEE